MSEDESFGRSIARRLVAGKVRNQRTLLQRNHVEPKKRTLDGLREMAERAEEARSLGELLGIEGNAARMYFGEFAGMMKPDEEAGTSPLPFEMDGRNRRPPRDPLNALLSFCYAMLTKDLLAVTLGVGFDPYLGVYHRSRYGRPALALDLAEEFRPLVADSVVLALLNNAEIGPTDFIRRAGGVALTPDGRRAVIRAYERRLSTVVTHPEFGYKISYRRVLDVQARILAAALVGELPEYVPMVTR